MMSNEILIQKLQNHKPAILGSENYSKYSILIPLTWVDGEIHVVFEVRAMGLRRQPGEVCFPGGRIDSSDLHEEDAAIRETMEELGISRDKVTSVFPLDYLISPFGMIVYAYAGFISDFLLIKPNQDEVGEVFTVPLSYFVSTEPKVYKVNFKAEPEKDFPYDLVVGGENYNWRTRQMDEYFYIYSERVIWGLTARILSHFVEIIK